MICAGRSRIQNALFPVRFEVKERSRRKLDVAQDIRLDRGELVRLAIELAGDSQIYLGRGLDLGVHPTKKTIQLRERILVHLYVELGVVDVLENIVVRLGHSGDGVSELLKDEEG